MTLMGWLGHKTYDIVKEYQLFKINEEMQNIFLMKKKIQKSSLL